MVSQTLDPSVAFGDDDRIQLRGIVDAVAGVRLGEVLAERVATGCASIDLDLSGVEAVDEHGLVAVVRAWHESSLQGCSLRLVDPSPAIGPLLSMSGLQIVASDDRPQPGA